MEGGVKRVPATDDDVLRRGGGVKRVLATDDNVLWRGVLNGSWPQIVSCGGGVKRVLATDSVLWRGC